MLVTIDAVGIRIGGGARLLLEFLDWLPKVRPDWEWVVYLLPRRSREFDDPPARNGVRIETVPIGDSLLGRLWWLYHGLPRRLARAGADVLLAFANVASPRCPVPQVVYVHQLLAFRSGAARTRLGLGEAKLRLLRALILRGALQSAAVIVQTDDMRRRLESAQGRLAGRVHVVPAGVCTVGQNGQIRPQKRRLIDEAARPRLVFVAHPTEHKNHLALLRAFRELVELVPQARLLLTIEPPGALCPVYSGVREVVEAIYAQVRTLDLLDKVVWLGILEPAEVWYLLANSDLFVFPSLTESFGLPLIEAMSVGCPIVAADREYAREICTEAAVYFDPEDPTAIAETLRRLLSDGAELRRLSRVGVGRAKNFSARRMAEHVCHLLEEAAVTRPVEGRLRTDAVQS